MRDRRLVKRIHVTHAARHVHAESGHIGRQVGREEQGRTGDILGRAHAAQRDLDVRDVVQHGAALGTVLHQLIPERRDDRAGLHAVHADAVLRQIHGQVHGQRLAGAFRHVILVSGRGRVKRAVRGADDDLSAARLLHVGHDREAAVIDAPLVHGGGLLEHFLLGQAGLSVKGSARERRENVDASELVVSLFYDGFDLFFIRYVGAAVEAGNTALRRDLVDDPLRVLLVPGHDHDFRTLARERFRGSFTHTGISSGDDGDLVLQHILHVLTPFMPKPHGADNDSSLI